MRFTTDRRAVASAEYAILAAAVGLALIAALRGLDVRLAVLFHHIGAAFSAQPSI